MLAWMAWTWQTALFFCLVALARSSSLRWPSHRPESPRVGILRFPTTRGDRFFVTLIGLGLYFCFLAAVWRWRVVVPARSVVVYGIAMFRFA